MLYISLSIAIFRGVITLPLPAQDDIYETLLIVLYWILILGLALIPIGLFMYMVRSMSSGKEVARTIFFIFCLPNLWIWLSKIFEFSPYGLGAITFSSFLVFLQVALQLLALMLLYKKNSSAWFKSMSAAQTTL